MKRIYLFALLLAVLAAGALLFGWGHRRGAASVDVRTVTRVDTVFYERPHPVSFSDRVVTVNIPKLLFAPADTVVRVVEAVNGADSRITTTNRDVMVPIVAAMSYVENGVEARMPDVQDGWDLFIRG